MTKDTLILVRNYEIRTHKNGNQLKDIKKFGFGEDNHPSEIFLNFLASVMYNRYSVT